MSALRTGFLALMIGVLLSCGGGGGGGAPMSSSSSALGSEPGVPVTAGALGGTSSDGVGNGNGIGGIASDDGNAAPSGSSSGSTTASGGDDGSGVGSGGTGVSTADATGVGTVDGAGSIIVNGLRYDTATAVGSVEDAPNGIQLGMSAKITGPVNADFTLGIARWVESAADIRGTVTSVSPGQGFVVLGTMVTTDDATVWADASGLNAISTGQTVQVWGLPAAPGVLRATRIEQRPPSSMILTGTVQSLDAAQRIFMLGNAVIDYSRVAPSGIAQPPANGTLVRVRADVAGPGLRLIATQVQAWYPVPRTDSTTAQIAGIVTEFAGLASLRVLSIPVDASAAQITGGGAGAIGNGVKV